MLDSSHFRRAAKATAPVFFGYIAIGIPFGLMVVNAGYSWWLSPLMSVIMYAGAGEYMAIGLFAAGARLSTIIIAELLVNVRHIVYGLSLISKYKQAGRWKPFLMFALTDETYALLTGCTLPADADAGAYFGTIALLDYAYWVAGSTIGALLGTLIPYDFAGVDFALTALFAVMLINQIRASRDIVPPLIGGSTTVGAVVLSRCGLLPADHILLVALSLGIAAIVLVRGGAFKAEQRALSAAKANGARAVGGEATAADDAVCAVRTDVAAGGAAYMMQADVADVDSAVRAMQVDVAFSDGAVRMMQADATAADGAVCAVPTGAATADGVCAIEASTATADGERMMQTNTAIADSTVRTDAVATDGAACAMQVNATVADGAVCAVQADAAAVDGAACAMQVDAMVADSAIPAEEGAR